MGKLIFERPLLEVMARGRWSTTTSLKRYAKSGKLQKIVNDLSVENLAYCEWAAYNVIAVLSGTVAALPPPSMGGSVEAYALPEVVLPLALADASCRKRARKRPAAGPVVRPSARRASRSSGDKLSPCK